jgi:hypothetical protein
MSSNIGTSGWSETQLYNSADLAKVDGWQISGIASYLSGAPQEIQLSIKTSTNVTGGGDGARVVLTCDPMHGAPHTFSTLFNTSCAQAPIAGSIGTAANPSGTPYSTGTGVFSPKVNFFSPWQRQLRYCAVQERNI